MSGITSIRRDYGDNVTIVRIITTDILSTVGLVNYILNQAANIVTANEGAFTWQTSDVVLVYAADGWQFFSISPNFNSLLPLDSGAQQVSIPLTAAQIDGMYAAPILLLAAPAAGTINIIGSVTLNEVYGGVVFAGGGAIGIQYENTVHGGGTLASTTLAAATLIAATANTTFTLGVAASIASAAAVAEPLYLSNQTAPFTGGTGSTFTLNFTYRNVAAS